MANCDRHVFDEVLKLEDEIEVYQFNSDSECKATITLLPESAVNNNDLVEVTLAPNFCHIAIAFSEAGKQELTKLLDWWSPRSIPQSLPQLIVLDAKQEADRVQAEFWLQMYRQTVQQNRATAQRIATLQRQYLALRKLHEDTQNAFSTVEAYLSKAKLPPIQLAFDTPIINKAIEPFEVNNSNSLILKQLLPLSSQGLAAIELHISRQYSEARGDLIVSLKACEDSSVNTVWKVPYQNLSPGWLGLDLPQIELGRKRDVELIIEWQTRIGPSPNLSLSKQQPILESRAYNDTMTLEHSLAIRLWQGLPGTRKVTSPYLISTNQQGQTQPQLGDLGQRAMASACEVTPNLPTDNFKHVQIFDRGARIMTHPRADGTATIAMLPYCFPATANRLTASVITNHEAAGTIEYAMAIIEPEVEPKQALNHDLALAFSNWIAVEPNTPRELTLDLAHSVDRNCHIVIAAKFPQDSPSDFAWAHWLNFCSAIAPVANSPVQTAESHPPESAPEPNPVQPASTATVAQDIPEHKIAQSQTVQLRDASLASLQTKFDKVQLIERENKIQVHPIKEGNTVAIIANAIAPNVTKIGTTVCTENQAADPVEYAIAVIADDDNTIARLAVASPTSALGFSGWQQVEANTLQNIDLNLNAPTPDTCHLVLATRLPKDASQTNAWARWINIEFD